MSEADWIVVGTRLVDETILKHSDASAMLIMEPTGKKIEVTIYHCQHEGCSRTNNHDTRHSWDDFACWKGIVLTDYYCEEHRAEHGYCRFCGNELDKKYDKDDYNTYVCAEHDSWHDSNDEW